LFFLFPLCGDIFRCGGGTFFSSEIQIIHFPKLFLLFFFLIFPTSLPPHFFFPFFLIFIPFLINPKKRGRDIWGGCFRPFLIAGWPPYYTGFFPGVVASTRTAVTHVFWEGALSKYSAFWALLKIRGCRFGEVCCQCGFLLWEGGANTDLLFFGRGGNHRKTPPVADLFVYKKISTIGLSLFLSINPLWFFCGGGGRGGRIPFMGKQKNPSFPLFLCFSVNRHGGRKFLCLFSIVLSRPYYLKSGGRPFFILFWGAPVFLLGGFFFFFFRPGGDFPTLNSESSIFCSSPEIK